MNQLEDKTEKLLDDSTEGRINNYGGFIISKNVTRNGFLGNHQLLKSVMDGIYIQKMMIKSIFLTQTILK